MSDQHWTIVDNDGNVIEQAITAGSHPRFHGFDFDSETMTAHQCSAQGDPITQSWDGQAHEWADDPAKIDAMLHGLIDGAAGALRLRYITDVPGQQLTYERKEREARAFLEADDPDLAAFPFLAAEASATGVEAEEAAQTIVAAADLWSSIGAAIERTRISAKRAVTEAPDRAAKQAAAIVDWEALG